MFHHDGTRWQTTQGVSLYLIEHEIDFAATGLAPLMAPLLTYQNHDFEFTAEALTSAAFGWDRSAIETAFAARDDIPQPPANGPVDQQAVDRFCQIWADQGYHEYAPGSAHYVFLDGCPIEEETELRAELLTLVQTLGLERTDTPPGREDGEVWVRTVPFIDAELGRWS